MDTAWVEKGYSGIGCNGCRRSQVCAEALLMTRDGIDELASENTKSSGFVCRSERLKNVTSDSTATEADSKSLFRILFLPLNNGMRSIGVFEDYWFVIVSNTQKLTGVTRHLRQRCS